MKKIAVVFGGKSPEHPVSIVSAKAVYKNIDKNKFKPVLVAITKQGEFYTGEGAFQFLEKGDKSGVKKTDCGIFKSFDSVFPVLHGPYGEDGTIQGLLEFLGIPYVGCKVEASAICMHKGISRDLFKIAKIPQPSYFYFSKQEKDFFMEKIKKELKFPVFVKPCRGGSSIGISKAESQKELEEAVMLAFKYDNEIIVEQGINVSEELEVAVLGNSRLTVSPPGSLIPGDEFYTYQDKYLNTKTKFQIPAKIPENIAEQILTYSKKAFETVKGRGMARIDFLYDKNKEKIFLNEINTIPGFTEISMYPKLMSLCGYSFTDLVTALIELSFQND